MDRDVFSQLAHEIAAARGAMAAARAAGTPEAWEGILAAPDFWSVRHDGMHSVTNMTREEQQQSIVEDLLFVEVERARGAAASYPVTQLHRHLGRIDHPAIRARLSQALEVTMARGLVVPVDGGLALAPDGLRAAMSFCGVYYDLDNLADPEDDVFDDLVAAGGPELAGDVFADVAEDMAENAERSAPTPGR